MARNWLYPNRLQLQNAKNDVKSEFEAMNTKTKIMSGLMGASLLAAPLANANSIELTITAGSDTATGIIYGTGVLAGDASWTGSIDGWNIEFIAGSTAPTTGSLANPILDLGSLNVYTVGSDPLVISFGGVGYTGSGAAFASISGNGSAVGTFNTYYDSGNSGNNLLSTANLLTSQSFTGATLDQTENGGPLGSVTPYSLTEVLTINSGLGSLDDSLSVPDGGLTVALLGFGLVGIQAYRRKLS